MQRTSRRSMTPARRSSCRLSSRSAASSESASSATAGAAPVSNSSSFTVTSSTTSSCVKDEPTPLRRPESTQPTSPRSVDLAAYYTFSKKNSKLVHDDTQGLSGFLEYRKLNGTWRPFLFQTAGYQLVLYRVHSTHQVMVMSTDIRSASEIALDYDGADHREETRLLRLGINGTTISLRAVTHRAAAYWVDGLQRLRDGKPLQFVSDPPSSESEEDIFDDIDKLLSLREWTQPPPSTRLCGICIYIKKPEPSPTAGMLLNTKKKSLDEGPSTGCKIC